MDANPCASVSWISRAMRSRSSAAPCRWWASDSRSWACSNSSMSLARSPLWATTEWTHSPISTLAATTMRVETTVDPRYSRLQPFRSQLPVSVDTVASPVKTRQDRTVLANSQKCGSVTMNSAA